jgi:hypothetical protein
MDISNKYQYISISVYQYISIGDGSLFVPFRYFVSLMRAAVFIFFRFSFPAPEKILVSRNFGRTIQITYKFVHSRRGAYEINRPSIRRALLEWTKEFSIGLGADLVGWAGLDWPYKFDKVQSNDWFFSIFINDTRNVACQPTASPLCEKEKRGR